MKLYAEKWKVLSAYAIANDIAGEKGYKKYSINWDWASGHWGVGGVWGGY